MRRYAVAVLAIVSLFAGVRSQAADGNANEEAVAKEFQAFKGCWRMSSKEEDGTKLSEEEIKDFLLTSDGSDRFLVRRGDAVFAEAVAQLDPTKKPRAIDLSFTRGERKGKTLLGIYKIEGDTFRVCVARPGDERPAEFSARAGSGRILIIYKRDKVVQELQAFKGTWRLCSKEEDGKKFSEEEIKGVIGTVNGSGRVSVRRGDKVISAGTITLDPTANPKTIDVTFTEGERKGKTALGIYEIESDAFRVCLARVGDERPVTFSARAGSGRILIGYKREKK
jgi:uncharacterized protein (TIGR03067 family)